MIVKGRCMMNGATVIAKILKQEKVDFLIAYPVNPIMVRLPQRRIFGRLLLPPGTTGAPYGGCREPPFLRSKNRGSCHAVGSRCGECLWGCCSGLWRFGPHRYCFGWRQQSRGSECSPNFNAALNYRHVTKYVEQIILTKQFRMRCDVHLHKSERTARSALLEIRAIFWVTCFRMTHSTISRRFLRG